MSNFYGINKIIFEYCHHPKPYLKDLESEVSLIKQIIDSFTDEIVDIAYGDVIEARHGILRSRKFSVIKVGRQFSLGETLYYAKAKKVHNLFCRINNTRKCMNLIGNISYYCQKDYNTRNRCWIGY